MKKLLLFKKIVIVILLAGLSSAGWAQLVYEDFNYATPAYIGGNGDAGTSSNNWTTHSVVAGHTTTINIEDGSLTYTGLASSAGNKLNFFSNTNLTDRDVNRGFTTSATTVYFSALINIVDNSQITVAGDYFMSFGATSGTAVTSLACRLGVKSVNSGANFRFIILNTTGGTPVYIDNGLDMSFGTTYLVVVKYDRSTVPTTASMWVNPTSLGGTEPAGAVSNTSGTSTFAAFASICLRNNAASPKAYIDEIRVGETWADVTPAGSTTPTITVTSPVAGYEWAQGTSHDINWTATGTNTDVMIEYSANASDVTPTWTTINASIAASAGAWSSWDIPAGQALSADSKIRITDIPQTTTGLSGIFSIIAAPAPVATFNPADAATVVDIASDITITFDVPVRNIDDSEITDANVASLLTLNTTDASGTAVPFTATIDAAKKVITINPDADLTYEQVYYVGLAPVEGLSDNATVAQSITFTAAPSIVVSISDVTITEVSPYIAGDIITINWVSSNVTDVMIEAWLPDQSIWTIMFASTPSDGNETFTIPTDAAYSTDYKIRVTDVSNTGVTAESGIFTIIAVANDLLTLRAQPVDAIVKYTGIATVTYARTSRNQKYIQDATAAVLIDDPTTAPGFITGTYTIGDGITNVVGKIALYNQLIEFLLVEPTGEPAPGAVIVPEVRTLASLTSADQCKLVTIEDFAFKSPTQWDATGLFVKSKNYDIDGVDNTTMAYRTLFAESDYIGGLVPVGPISSICLVGQFNAQMQITARSWSDMITPTVAEFVATPTFVIEGDSVEFQDMSTNNPTAWEWSFVGGTPAVSTEQNPHIRYMADGVYSVTLKVTNAFGDNTISKTDYITVGGVGFSTLPSVVSVYPNPTNGKLFITNPAKEKQEIAVFNSLGKQVNASASADGIISLEITNHAKGIYIIRLTNKVTKSVQFKKVVLN